MQLQEVGAKRCLNGTSKVNRHIDGHTDGHFDLFKESALRADSLKIQKNIYKFPAPPTRALEYFLYFLGKL